MYQSPFKVTGSWGGGYDNLPKYNSPTHGGSTYALSDPYFQHDPFKLAPPKKPSSGGTVPGGGVMPGGGTMPPAVTPPATTPATPATGTGMDYGSMFGDPNGRFLKYADRMMRQVPVDDFQTALKGVRPSHGRSQDAGTYAQAQQGVASSMANAANIRSQIPYDLYRQQAQEQVGLAGLQDALDSQMVGLQNQRTVPFLQALLDYPQNIMGGLTQGIGGLLGGIL